MSLVSTASGVPVVFYHGTSRSFGTFDAAFVGTGMTDSGEPEVGFFFTPSRRFALRYAQGAHAAIVRVHLGIERPYRVTGTMWGMGEGLSPEAARDAGHDAYVVSPYDEGDMWIVFDPSRITVVGRDPVLRGRRATDMSTTIITTM